MLWWWLYKESLEVAVESVTFSNSSQASMIQHIFELHLICLPACPLYNSRGHPILDFLPSIAQNACQHQHPLLEIPPGNIVVEPTYSTIIFIPILLC